MFQGVCEIHISMNDDVSDREIFGINEKQGEKNRPRAFPPKYCRTTHFLHMFLMREITNDGTCRCFPSSARKITVNIIYYVIPNK